RRGRVGAVERSALWEATARLAAAYPSEEIESEPGLVEAGPNLVEAEIVPIRPDLPCATQPRLHVGQPVALRDTLAQIERGYIEEALVLSDGVIADAARMLSLQRTTLIEKMRKYEMKAA